MNRKNTSLLAIIALLIPPLLVAQGTSTSVPNVPVLLYTRIW
jgi:hypothetical protein